ncbi:MAG: GNAT family N-acetyltransferase [Promethearchaeota archaeon]
MKGHVRGSTNLGGQLRRLEGMAILTRMQVNKTAKMMARAFINYPLIKFLFPRLKSRMKMSKIYFKAIIVYGNKFGKIFTTSPDCKATSIMLDEYVANFPFKRVIKSGIPWRFALLGLPFLFRFKRQETHQHAMYKKNTNFPHYYIILVAVDPDEQGKGLGSQLIQEMVAWLDEKQLPAYLETYTRENVNIYKKHGFDVVDESSIPKTNIQFWGMAMNHDIMPHDPRNA